MKDNTPNKTETVIAVIIASIILLPLTLLRLSATWFAIYGGSAMVGWPLSKTVALWIALLFMLLRLAGNYQRDRRFKALEAKVAA